MSGLTNIIIIRGTSEDPVSTLFSMPLFFFEAF